MAINTPQIIQTVTNTPIPMMLEKLGVSIAQAQAALDANSIRTAQEMANVAVSIGDKSHNLISLGFAPTFYAFTEATIEVKMDISIAESEDYGGSLNLNFNSEKNGTKDQDNSSDSGSNTNDNEDDKAKNSDNSSKTSNNMFGLSVTAHYARKFAVSAESSSSIAAKIVSLPAPDAYYEILKSSINK